ncbi:MAG: methyltransferase [Thaumarchaeota archaeon]|nr:methyltransferase [Nitrososphaerota archaeon]MCY3975985.1 methyltransferase [Nitrososphaerota archaeon]
MQKKLDFYNPSEDTFFFADNLKHEKGYSALDIGTGSGYLAQVLLNNFKFVVATDINFDSLKLSENLSYKICCKNADALLHRFDLIVFNPPYLPSSRIQDVTIDGGKDGIEITLKIIESAKFRLKSSGSIIFLTSSLSNYNSLLHMINSIGFGTEIINRKKLFFEELIMVKAKIKKW